MFLTSCRMDSRTIPKQCLQWWSRDRNSVLKPVNLYLYLWQVTTINVCDCDDCGTSWYSDKGWRLLLRISITLVLSLLVGTIICFHTLAQRVFSIHMWHVIWCGFLTHLHFFLVRYRVSWKMKIVTALQVMDSPNDVQSRSQSRVRPPWPQIVISPPL